MTQMRLLCRGMTFSGFMGPVKGITWAERNAACFTYVIFNSYDFLVKKGWPPFTETYKDKWLSQANIVHKPQSGTTRSTPQTFDVTDHSPCFFPVDPGKASGHPVSGSLRTEILKTGIWEAGFIFSLKQHCNALFPCCAITPFPGIIFFLSLPSNKRNQWFSIQK